MNGRRLTRRFSAVAILVASILVIAGTGLASSGPPRPVIKSKPSLVTSRSSAVLRFAVVTRSSKHPVRWLYKCRLDRGSWHTCTSPARYSKLREGGHLFSVKAAAKSGATGRVAQAWWRVDRTPPPPPVITAGPSDPSASGATQITVSDADASATLRCSFDNAPLSVCQSPISTTLPDGTHDFVVEARDRAGNRSAQTHMTWRIQTPAPAPAPAPTPSPTPTPTPAPPPPPPTDTTPPPAPSITGSSFGDLSNTTGQFTFSDSESGVSFVCAVDGAAPSSCASPASVGPVGDGSHTFAVAAVDTAGNRSSPVTQTWSAIAGQTIAAAGDVACAPTNPDFNSGNGTGAFCMQKATADLLGSLSGLSAILPLGDEQYDCGELANFNAVYDNTWGRFKSIEHPVPGNHEYGITSSVPCTPSNASGYFSYFGNIAGTPGQSWYSYDVGSWHLIALNSNCTSAFVDCNAEHTWLENDLATHPASCVLAYWHHPRFSAGQTGDDPQTADLWNDLVAAHADLVLSGHDHTYQRFTTLDKSGNPVAGGLREIVVGTGGDEHHMHTSPHAGLEISDNTTFGVLKLTLGGSGYVGQFIPAAGSGTFTDSFTGSCN